MTAKREKLLLIVGPTAVGKTKLSVELAQAFQGEVISGDSMQIYKKLDIGTAKVTQAERQDVPHYLLDINEIDERFSAADFIELTTKVAKTIQHHDHLPIIAGGTGFYLQALIDEFQLGQDDYQATQTIRAKWQDFLAEQGNQALYDELLKIDPVAAEKIGLNNPRRLMRALEVYEATGELFSAQNDQKVKNYDTLIIGLTTDRALLYERINQRVDLMMQQGLLEEARYLYEKGGLGLPAGKGIGYKEFFPYFEGKISLAEAVELVKRNSRRYAKRQLTWFRNKMDVEWFDLVQNPDQMTAIKQTVKDWLAD